MSWEKIGNWDEVTDSDIIKGLNFFSNLVYHHPLLDRYASHVRTNDLTRDIYTHNTQAWQAQGDRLSSMISILSDGFNMQNISQQESLIYKESNRPFRDASIVSKSADPVMPLYSFEKGNVGIKHNLVNVLSTVTACYEAEVYLWNNEMIELSRHIEIPAHTVSRDQIPFSSIFFSFERAVPIYKEELGHNVDDNVPWKNGETTGEYFNSLGPRDVVGYTTWMLLFEDFNDEGDAMGCRILMDVQPSKKEEDEGAVGGVMQYALQYGVDYPESFENHHSVKLVLGLLTFMQQRIAVVKKQRLSRAVRKELQRKKMGSYDPETNVISLRHTDYYDGPSGDSSDGPMNRTHRWLVSRHYRKQWYPSKGGHKLILIDAHIKGPKGKPLKLSTRHVNK